MIARTDRLFGLLTVMAALALAACLLALVGVRSAQATFPGANGKIVVTRATSTSEGNNWEIYSIDTNGGEPTNLTNDPALDMSAAVSANGPDGQKIAFASDRDSPPYANGLDIYTMDANGDNPTRLTNDSPQENYPTFSPDGSKIAFVGNRPDEYNSEIYVMDAKDADGNGVGDNRTNLTNTGKDTTQAPDMFGNYPDINESMPIFSPDGQEIVFSLDGDIYSMPADGGEPTNLTNTAAYEEANSFSPDGQKIAFSDHGGGPEVYVMDADGQNRTRLTNDPHTDSMPVFSPDGQKIAFTSNRANNPNSYGDVYVMDAVDSTGDGNGDNLERITDGAAHYYKPDWAVASQTTTLDANTLPVPSSNSGGIGLDSRNSLGQTFTALNSGKVTSAQLHLQRYSSGPGDLKVELTNTDSSGKPSTVLASTMVAASEISEDSYSLVTASFSNPPSIEAGKKYALVISTSSGCCYGWSYSMPIGAYSDGVLMYNYDSEGWQPQGSYGGGVTDGTFAIYLTPSDSTTTPVDSASDDVEADGTASTGSGGKASPASPADPVNTTIKSPLAGTVSITEGTYDSDSGQQPVVDDMYTFFGQQIDITVPQASTWDKPYKFEFVVDSSLLDGATAQDIEVFRNGARVVDCADESGKASPDPCVIAAPLPDGKADDSTDDDLLLTVYTSDASKWNIGKKNPENNQELYNGFKGFLSPVDNPKTLNTVKAGSAVPVKFSLGGDKGLSIFAEGYPKPKAIDCDTTAPTDAIEMTTSDTSSKLTYDAKTGQYNYVWKTDKSWTGCKQLVLVLKDGSSYRANFKFTK